MAVRMPVTMASMYGVCKACPYNAECAENCNAKHPPYAWCERFQAADESKRAKMRREAEIQQGRQDT